MTAAAIANTTKLTRSEIAKLKEASHAIANTEIKALHARYLALAKLEKEASDEKELIKTRIATELEKLGKVDFVDETSKPLIGFTPTTRNELDREKLDKRFGAAAVKSCYSKKEGRSFFAKKR